MTDDLPPHPALLPVGFTDLLPPDAEAEARLTETLTARFGAHGYQRVKPPLVEFESTLFAGSGAAVAEQTFRFMDPESQRMMGLRADTTPQIARIATTRLAAAPRPLRLAYAGQCLLVRGSHLAPERQVAQAGIELIGPDLPEADAEIIIAAAAALEAAGVASISIDLTMPPLIPALLGDTAGQPALVRALDRKDTAAIAALGGALAPTLRALLEAAGPAEPGMAALAAIALPDAVRGLADRLAATIAAIRHRAPALRLTIDPVEFRGYRYHTGVAVTIFAPGRQAELGRGGRYLCDNGESATGITLYPDTILKVAPRPAARPRLFLPAGTPPSVAQACRDQQFATIAGLLPVADDITEAKRLLCTHVWRDDHAVALEGF
ncbi:MAG: ATP phosphoribosyltransferase regulatory subunit [Acidiphilium sp. 37-64-53]|uniref:ATP phosphoribosyltransferase regulatory subunit n=1 Tax=Acidiphilium TaxID=522 RepID=UPI000BD0A9F5|nr:MULTISPECIES: ATP phosphoribosyltransferase regulatory subunit [Acidiphilium]OYW02780.1 MAG: ATP phosphoribosyltransferase regulatory subunit [Acidiphilium sp. 37-64-53]OZB29193.1 MAG: ATP phosphoribosyltransferase regulatory subunit [Acidiphilium sp. 34-64-41]HQT84749.1 ATP phosphoribosyltransferase regulatory subunit [Acidiphilium rubrum]